MFDLFLSAPRCHGTYLVMLNTYNYVVLGWNTTSPSFTIHLLQQKVKHHFKFHVLLKTVMVRVRVWSSRQTYGRYYTETCGKYCREEGRVTIIPNTDV